jgi:DNA end-binding protein Ku
LEGLFEAVAGHVPGGALSSDFGDRKGHLQPDQQATGHRIKYTKVDAETGDKVPSEDIIKGYKVDTDTYVTVDKDELENIALESTRTIDIDEFVPRSEIDELYLVRPYYIVPDGKVGHDAYAVIRETIGTMQLRGSS